MRTTTDEYGRLMEILCVFVGETASGNVVLYCLFFVNWILPFAELYCDLRVTGYITVTEAQMADDRMLGSIMGNEGTIKRRRNSLLN